MPEISWRVAVVFSVWLTGSLGPGGVSAAHAGSARARDARSVATARTPPTRGAGLPGYVPADTSWADTFQAPGADSVVYALRPEGDTLFVGGAFERVSTLRTSSVAYFDGAVWHAMGGGLPGSVRAFTRWNGDLIAAGTFTRAQGAPADFVARWDGTAWQPLADELDSSVNALAVHQGELVAGGVFQIAGAESLHCIARFDGAQWRAFGGGMTEHDPVVYTLLSAQNILYAGGHFLKADGDTVNNVAQWAGSEWVGMAGGLSSGVPLDAAQVRALAPYGAQLLIAGDWGLAGGKLLGSVVLWNGTTWKSVHNALSANHAAAVIDARIYVGGTFNTIQYNVPASNAGQYTGTVWRAMEGGLYNADSNWREVGLCIAFYRNQVIYGGHFVLADSARTENLAAWTGTDWVPFGEGAGLGFDGTAFTTYNGSLICGGGFESAGMIETPGIAAWNGSAYSALGGGLNATPWGLAVYHGDLIAGGYFTGSGNTTLSYIGRWNGSTWQPLGSGMNGAVRALYVWRDSLVAVGYFTTAGGVSALHVAVWDGTSWHALGGGVNDWAASIGEWNGQLVIGGAFTQADGLPAAAIAAWDGGAWRALGGGCTRVDGANPVVYAVEPFLGQLVAGGDFDRAGGATARCLAAWDGATWREVGGGVGGVFSQTRTRVADLLVDGPALMVCGVFYTCGDSTTNYIARWDGAQWYPLGWGLQMAIVSQGGAWALGRYDGALYVGGNMIRAGGKPSSYIARWDGADLVTGLAPLPVPDAAMAGFSLDVPRTVLGREERAIVTYSLPRAARVHLAVYDVRGRVVARLGDGERSGGVHALAWQPGAALAAGIYLVRLETPEGAREIRLVVTP